MEKEIEVNDMCLQGKFIISNRTIGRLFPFKMVLGSESIRVRINKSLPIWVLTLCNGEQWYYEPYSHRAVKVEGIRFGRIFFGRFARYLRNEYEHKGCTEKLYATYFCVGKAMFLVKETKEQGTQKAVTKWFSSFCSAPEAEELTQNDEY